MDEGFIERLKIVMEEKGYSRYKIAKNAPITSTTIGNWLKGKTQPEESKLMAFCQFMEINLHWLKTGEGPRDIVKEENKKYDFSDSTENEGNSVYLSVINQLTLKLQALEDKIKDLNQQIADLKQENALLKLKLANFENPQTPDTKKDRPSE